MKDREYIRQEAETLYNYILDDEEKFDNMKHVYARIFNSIEGIAECQVGGIDNLEISVEDIKDIIKDVVESSPRKTEIIKKLN